jgi:hypothetical protein
MYNNRFIRIVLPFDAPIMKKFNLEKLKSVLLKILKSASVLFLLKSETLRWNFV